MRNGLGAMLNYGIVVPMEGDQPARTSLDSAIAHRTTVRKVTILDTAIAGTNLGDQVIMEAVYQEAADLFADYATFTVATHEWMGGQCRYLIRQSDWTIAGGTNLLSSRMWFRCNWKVKPIDGLSRLNVVLMGP